MNAIKSSAVEKDSIVSNNIEAAVVVIEGFQYPLVPKVLPQTAYDALPQIAKHALVYGFQKKLIDAVAGKGDAKGFDKAQRAEIIGKIYRRLTEEKVWNKGAFGDGGRKAKTLADRATELGLEMSAQERAFLEKFAEAERKRKENEKATRKAGK